MTSTLQIECAKPDCHWKGSPAEAPTHPCPTPAVVADEVAEQEETAVAERAELDAKLAAAGVSYDPGTSIEGMRELLALATGSQEPLEEPEIAESVEPESRDEIEAWLGEHGNYDDHGIPQDEKTARLDARLSSLVATGEPEPALDEDEEPVEAELVEQTAEGDGIEKTAIEVPLGETGTLTIDGDAVEEGPRPFEIVIAEALEGQPSVKEYRWLVIWTPADETREAELIGRAKVKSEATVIQEDIEHRGQLTGPISIHKTADIIAAAEKLQAEIVKRRELVEPDPDVVVETPAEPETPEAPAPTPVVQPKPGETQALFDASDFEREDLAISKVDGHGIDRIALAFSGTVMLDRSNPAHVALFNRAKIGQDLDLWVNATGAGVATKPNTNRDGDLDVIVSTRSLRVDTLRILSPAELEDAGREIALQARDAHEAGEDAAT